ncbi:MAG TPA: NUDIX domain-containing protein [Chitinophagaceae bacterium]|nr:NUDIX domain-containing protein [Chitinophagaceae bacterium]HPG10805.1 NUDIX domain-containing protein [Chitinophagaceae bacterium]
MYLKIYFGDKPLFLCDNIDETIEPYVHHDDAIFIDELNSHTIKAMIHEMELPQIHAGVFFHEDLDELKKSFYKKFTLVQAGGGLVKNERGEILMIFRRGKWDLPKGKLDEGEHLEQCAIREVEEETGLLNVSSTGPLMVTHHTYHEGARHILKESHWYSMSVKGEQQLVPQTIEQITEVKWAKASELPDLLKETFPSVKDVLESELNQS